MRGGHSPFALQQRSAEVRRAKRLAREQAELERRREAAREVVATQPRGVKGSPETYDLIQGRRAPARESSPPDSGDTEAGFVLPSWLRFGSRVPPAPVQVRLAHMPVTRDIRAETENYNAEIAERAANRDSLLPRARGRRKYLYGSDTRGPGPTPGQVMDFKF
jgi:hypothetical protein